MNAWKPERQLRGPHRPGERDIDALNRLFSEAFTERYRRDGMVGVRVPQLNPRIWQYAIEDAGAGAMVWYDEHGAMVAFNIAHHSGTEGWMGPLAVRTDMQALGIGKVIVQAAVDWLRAEGARTIGLETMPRTVENIGFYSRLGFLPKYLTTTMTGSAARRAVAGEFTALSDVSPDRRAALIEACRMRLNNSVSEYDFTREFELTLRLRLGDAAVLDREGGVEGFALWHSVPLARNQKTDEIRVLKLFADSVSSFERLMAAAERSAARLRVPRVAVRCQTAYVDAYRALVRMGYSVRWTDLRMTLDGHPEAALPQGEILFSNWEI